ncbi:hypothetical protein EMA8858_03543 [Emticicia aquatica]|uniref:Transposase n=1 Tax=Emticicia aquatica TaxID=1681835 RepID=A0ABM9ATS7_9BACT|nr:hypothetical protein [Emticicia aquatica]CAH0997410.1 hypothetical protein EMA8858_03543 [Emticicia aquatica]
MTATKPTSTEQKVLKYELQENGYYQLIECPIGFNKLPKELKIEPTQRPDLILNGAKEVLRGRIKGGNYTFFTGLRHLHDRKFYGNKEVQIKGKKWRMLIVAEVSSDNQELTLTWTNRAYLTTSQIVEELKKFM